MELPNRGRLESQLRSAVRKTFKQYRTLGTRQPPWVKIRRELEQNVKPILDRIKSESARTMAAKYADDPLPPDFDPGGRTATEFAADVVSRTARSWLKMPRRTKEVREAFAEKHFGEDRIAVIGTTEATFAHQAGENAVMDWLDDADLEAIWQVEEGCTKSGPCEECQKMHNKPKSYWEQFYPLGPGSVHPSCCCWLKYRRRSRR